MNLNHVTLQTGYTQNIEHLKFVDSEIANLCATGAICPVKEKPKCVHAMRCVPKKGGKLRLVMDCRHVNKYIDTPSFNQEGINIPADLIESGDDLVTADLKNGFHHVPVNIAFQMCWY